MSMDIALTCDCCGSSLLDVNYTSNVSEMVVAALGRAGIGFGKSWLSLLDGVPGPEGAALLGSIIWEFDADPAYFEAMNPSNGWGNFRTFRDLLVEMLATVPNCSTTWTAGA